MMRADGSRKCGCGAPILSRRMRCEPCATEHQRLRQVRNMRSWRAKNPERRRVLNRRCHRKRRAKYAVYYKNYIADPAKKKRACERQREWKERNKAKVAAKAALRGRLKKQGLFVRERRENRLFDAAYAAVPKTLPHHVRSEVVSLICMAVLTGEIAERDIAKKWKTCLKANNREYDTFKTVSLDATVPGTDGARLIDMLPDDARWETRA